LKDKGAYVIPKEITDPENLLDIEVRGQYLIPYSYKKAVENGGVLFDPDRLLDVKTNFCKVKFVEKSV